MMKKNLQNKKDVVFLQYNYINIFFLIMNESDFYCPFG